MGRPPAKTSRRLGDGAGHAVGLQGSIRHYQPWPLAESCRSYLLTSPRLTAVAVGVYRFPARYLYQVNSLMVVSPRSFSCPSSPCTVVCCCLGISSALRNRAPGDFNRCWPPGCDLASVSAGQTSCSELTSHISKSKSADPTPSHGSAIQWARPNFKLSFQ